MIGNVSGKKTVADRVAEYGGAVRARLVPEFARIGATYPPRRMMLVGLKREKVLEAWTADEAGPYALLKSYPILAASGELGPKLREGDRRVPEGVYRVESLNPNSRFHLALRLDYPNEFDRRMAAAEGRTDLGGDIMIHGSNCSIGCLALGDEAAEELFVMAAETGASNITVILAPCGFRRADACAELPDTPAWIAELYETIRRTMRGVSRKP